MTVENLTEIIEKIYRTSEMTTDTAESPTGEEWIEFSHAGKFDGMVGTRCVSEHVACLEFLKNFLGYWAHCTGTLYWRIKPELGVSETRYYSHEIKKMDTLKTYSIYARCIIAEEKVWL